MTASVIIVSHRPHRWLRTSIESVLGEADEVIVVDNGSGGDVAAIAADLGALVCPLPSNVGFPAGVNAGVAMARGDVVALLNDDAFADPGWIASAARELERPGVAAVSPKIVFALPYAMLRFEDEARFVGDDPRPLGRALRSVRLGERELLPALVGPGIHRIELGELDGRPGPWRWTTGPDPIYVPLPADAGPSDLRIDGEPPSTSEVVTLINSAGAYLSGHGFGGDYGFASPDDGSFDAPAERFGGCGAALVTTAATWQRVGGLAGDFFAYYEDLDWSWRVRLAGLSVRYQPEGCVRHVGGATTGGPVDQTVQRLAARNRLLCLARNAPLPVLASELRRDRDVDRRTVARRLPRSLAQRARLHRAWETTPHAVWSRWAGVDERWPSSAPS